MAGDNAEFRHNAAGVFTSGRTLDNLSTAISPTGGPTGSPTGGNDSITLGDGRSTVFGGVGVDTISTGAGQGTVLGDNGSVTLDATGALYQQVSSAQGIDSSGGDDSIVSGEGAKLIIGGAGADRISSGSGDDRVLGDNGSFSFDAAGRLSSMRSTQTGQGGDDRIDVGAGNNLVIGGAGSDHISSGDGNDLILGDSGELSMFAGTERLQQVRSIAASDGGDDQIRAGAGDDVVVGGTGADLIQAGNSTGQSIVLGDNGQIDWSAPGLLSQVLSTDIGQGGDDRIALGDGAKTIIGGQGRDQISAGVGLHLVAGDNAQFNYGFTADLVHALSTDTNANTGDDDTITLGHGNNLVLGGLGSDRITTGNGLDLVLGDGGELQFSADGHVLERVASFLAPAEQGRQIPLDQKLRSQAALTAVAGAIVAGDDVISLGDGQKMVLGGVGRDDISAGVGQHVVFGDNGQIDFNDQGRPIRYQTLQPDDTAGDADSVVLGDGDNVVFGGIGVDLIITGLGSDIIFGDNGVLVMDGSGSRLLRLVSTEQELGAGDLISTGGGAKTILGGAGSDTVLAGVNPISGRPASAPAVRVVFGDAGEVIFNGAGLAISFRSLSAGPASGDADTLRLGDGDNVIVGGAAGDHIVAGDGANVVLGDGGQLLREASGLAWLRLSSTVWTDGDVSTLDLSGGDDQISTGNGRNIVIGGYGHDRVRTGVGADLVFGDNGRIDFMAGSVAMAISTDTADASGGNDELNLGDGDKAVIAGVGRDKVTTGAGRDTVLGDGGSMLFNASGRVLLVITGDPRLGGDDTVALGDGDDLAIGGAGNDSLQGEGGRDSLIGDGAKVEISSDGRRIKLLSIDVTIGGNDRLDGGPGIDVLIGGQGSDLMVGALSEDLLLGSNAAVTIFDGLVQSIQADMHDLGTSTLFAHYDASGQSRHVPGPTQVDVERVSTELTAFASTLALQRPGSVLAANALRNLFQSALAAATVPASAEPTPMAEVPAAESGVPAPRQLKPDQSADRDEAQPVSAVQRLQQALAPQALSFNSQRAEADPAGKDRLAHSLVGAAASPDLAGAIGAPLLPRALGAAQAEVPVTDASLVLAMSSAGLLAHRRLLDHQAMLGNRTSAGSISRRALDAVTQKWFGDADDVLRNTIPIETSAMASKAIRARIDW